jgi:hypothetical protein
MARKPGPELPAEKAWTPDLIRGGMKKLRRRLNDVEAFEPKKVADRSDPGIRALEAAIRATLAEVFGTASRTYRNYQAAASIDTAGINMNGTPHHEVIEGLIRGRARSSELLRGAIRWLEEKMEDDFPGEPLDQVALSATSMAASAGTANLSANPGIVGAEARGIAGNIRVSIQNDTPTGGVIIAEGETEARFLELMGRVTLLGASLNQLRRELTISTGNKQIGIGHNQGPDFEPIPFEELDEVDDLIALLLEQGPVPPSDPTEIIERSQKATRISDKIKQYLDVFASEVAKGAGGEIGKRLVQVPIWMAVYHGIDRVTQALAVWIGTLPH